MGRQGSKRASRLARWSRPLALGVAVGWCALGCTAKTQSSDDLEREHPLMKAAQEKERSGDEAAAIEIYKALIAQNPDMARPHLALAFLLDRMARDPAGAIYHFQRYLDLRPDTEKHDMLESRIRQDKIQLISTVFPSVSNLSERLLVAERNNDEIRVRVSNLAAQLQFQKELVARLRAQAAAVEAADRVAIDKVTPPAAGIRPPVRTVVVGKGDTLIKLAAQVYGDASRWREILAANRNVLRNPDDVRPGQLLVVP